MPCLLFPPLLLVFFPFLVFLAPPFEPVTVDTIPDRVLLIGSAIGELFGDLFGEEDTLAGEALLGELFGSEETLAGETFLGELATFGELLGLINGLFALGGLADLAGCFIDSFNVASS